MEVCVLDYFPSYLTLSILCDADIKLIGKSQFQIFNESDISVSIGFSCFPLPRYAHEEKITDSIKKTNKYLMSTDTELDEIMNKIGLKPIKFLNIKENNTQSFCSYLWLNCINLIAFDVLSIVFEDLEFTKILKKEETSHIFDNIIDELITIALKAGAPDLFNLIKDKDNPGPSLAHCYKEKISKNKPRDPLYLNHSNVIYCFVHQIKLPLSFLILQPLLLAEAIDVKTPSLQFIYAIYSRIEKITESKFIQRIPLRFKPILEREFMMKQKLVSKQKIEKTHQQIKENKDIVDHSEDKEPLDQDLVDVFFEIEQFTMIDEENHTHEQIESIQEVENEVISEEVYQEVIEYDYGDGVVSNPIAKSLVLSRVSSTTDDGIQILGKEDEKLQKPKKNNGGKPDYFNNTKYVDTEVRRRYYENSESSLASYNIQGQTHTNTLTNDELRKPLLENTVKKLITTVRNQSTNSSNYQELRSSHNNMIKSINMDGLLELTTGRYGGVDSTKSASNQRNQ